MKRVSLPTEAAFTSRLRQESLTARLGTWLGIAFGLCFLTGLFSHWYYLYDAPWVPPVRPVWGYRVTQGVHVLSGIAAIPLLLVKLWSVYPKLFGSVPRDRLRPLLVNLAEKASIAVLALGHCCSSPSHATFQIGPRGLPQSCVASGFTPQAGSV